MTTLTGTRRLVRLALRRDRVVLPVWIVGLTGLLAAVVTSVLGLYASDRERSEAATFAANDTVTRAFNGPVAGSDPGSLVMSEAFVFVGVLVALMCAQAVVRHTRTEEETGRAELIGAGVVGRHARLTAALAVAFGAALLVGAAAGVVLTASGLPTRGSLLAGAAYAGVGVVFGGVAAVTAQVAEQARAANAWAGGVLGLAFLVRAIGDAAGHVASSGDAVVSAWPSWVSPLGWGQQVRPFAAGHLGPFALTVAAAALLAGIAYVLTDHRDVGQGMRSVRPGPARADTGLLRPLGLAWRQQRGVLLGWLVAMAILGAAFGAVGESTEDISEMSEQFAALLEQFGGGSLVDGYFAFLMRLVAILTAGYTVQALLRLRSEEAAGRLEPLLATAVARPRWLLAQVVLAAAGTAAVLLLAGAAAGVAYGLATGDLAGGVGGPLSAAAVQVPAALALGGGVVLVFGLQPRWTAPVAWGGLAFAFVVGQFGGVLDLPQAVINLSPFVHPPLLPAADLDVTPVVVLLLVAVALAAVGVAAFRRRDLVTAA
jgi:ABC-2 type transport system permease protein